MQRADDTIHFRAGTHHFDFYFAVIGEGGWGVGKSKVIVHLKKGNAVKRKLHYFDGCCSWRFNNGVQVLLWHFQVGAFLPNSDRNSTKWLVCRPSGMIFIFPSSTMCFQHKHALLGSAAGNCSLHLINLAFFTHQQQRFLPVGPKMFNMDLRAIHLYPNTIARATPLDFIWERRIS